MKRRTIHNDPISASERCRGAVIIDVAADLDLSLPAKPAGDTNARR